MITRKRNLSMEFGDESDIVIQLNLPFHLILVFVAAISKRMDLWELSLQLCRRFSINDDEGLLEGVQSVAELFYRWGTVTQPANEEPDRETTNMNADITEWSEPALLDDDTEAAIDALCAQTYNPAWDIGNPQPNSPDVLFQVRLVMDDIDDFGESLPY